MEKSKGFGVVCLVGAVLLWSCTPVFVKHFAKADIHADVQNLFRYAAATLGLWIIILAWFGGEALHAWRRWHAFLIPTVINCVFQVILVRALYLKSIYPTFSSLLAKSSVVFSVVLAFLLFKDERRTILSRRYLTGCLLAGVGVAGVIAFGARAGGAGGQVSQSDFAKGAALILAQAFLWACYILSMKPAVRNTRPLVAFAIVATFTTVFFAALTCIRSDPMQFFEISRRNQVLMLLSGVAFISGAHSLYFRAVERLGVGICASFALISPFSTGLLSWLWHGESLAAPQILMGTVLLLGAFLIVAASRPKRLPAGPDKPAA